MRKLEEEAKAKIRNKEWELEQIHEHNKSLRGRIQDDKEEKDRMMRESEKKQGKYDKIMEENEELRRTTEQLRTMNQQMESKYQQMESKLKEKEEIVMGMRKRIREMESGRKCSEENRSRK